MKKIFLLVILCFSYHFLLAQKILVNSPEGLYELTGMPGDCSIGEAIPYCTNYDERIFSTALHNDVLYFVSGKRNDLYRTSLKYPHMCARVASLPPDGFHDNYNALTVDLYGNVYALSLTGQLVRYKYGDQSPTIIGMVPQGSGGDMIYHKGDLYYTTAHGDIYKINLDNPRNSTFHMRVQDFVFYGLISLPFSCNQNMIYGIYSQGTESFLVEIDLDNKTSSGIVCSLPINIYDAASVVEDGRTMGVILDSVKITGPCKNLTNTFNLQLYAFSSSPGDIMYSMNGEQNNTGIYNNITEGMYNIHISNSRGCTLDTIINIGPDLSPHFTVDLKQPQSCIKNDGEIEVLDVSTTYNPVTFSLNGGPFSIQSKFTDLPSGPYQISVKDQSGCQRDTLVALTHIDAWRSISSMSVKPSICSSASGNIKVTLDKEIKTWQVFLDKIFNGRTLDFNNLKPKDYLLSVVYGNDNCRYDTIVRLSSIEAPRPEIDVKTESPKCHMSNGEINIKVHSQTEEYTILYNQQLFEGNQHLFSNLSPGDHRFTIQNKYLCSWDTVVALTQLDVEPIEFSVQTQKPSCKQPNSGEILVKVTGNQNPYKIKYNNLTMPAGKSISGLSRGIYDLQIINQQGCIVDAITTELTVDEDPECDKFIMPNAFTPNKDGKNETIKPVHSPFLSHLSFEIFNRYGQRLFQYRGNGAGWDGSFNGKPQPSDTYVWKAFYLNFIGKQTYQSGSFILIR